MDLPCGDHRVCQVAGLDLVRNRAGRGHPATIWPAAHPEQSRRRCARAELPIFGKRAALAYGGSRHLLRRPWRHVAHRRRGGETHEREHDLAARRWAHPLERTRLVRPLPACCPILKRRWRELAKAPVRPRAHRVLTTALDSSRSPRSPASAHHGATPRLPTGTTTSSSSRGRRGVRARCSVCRPPSPPKGEQGPAFSSFATRRPTVARCSPFGAPTTAG